MLFPNTNTGRYIKAIKNAEKRKYAEAFWMFCCGYQKEEPPKGNLSGMAAQAVRLQIRDMMRKD